MCLGGGRELYPKVFDAEMRMGSWNMFGKYNRQATIVQWKMHGSHKRPIFDGGQ